MATLAAMAIAAYLFYHLNRRTNLDKPEEHNIDQAEIEAPTPTSSNPIVEGPGHPKRWRKANEDHKAVFARLNNIKPISPLFDMQEQREKIQEDELLHNQKTLDKLILE